MQVAWRVQTAASVVRGYARRQAFEDADRILILIESLGNHAGGKLITGSTGGGIAGCGVNHTFGAGGIVEIEENVGFELRALRQRRCCQETFP